MPAMVYTHHSPRVSEATHEVPDRVTEKLPFRSFMVTSYVPAFSLVSVYINFCVFRAQGKGLLYLVHSIYNYITL